MEDVSGNHFQNADGSTTTSVAGKDLVAGGKLTADGEEKSWTMNQTVGHVAISTVTTKVLSVISNSVFLCNKFSNANRYISFKRNP